MSNYITKEFIDANIKQNQFNYILSPMSSGKTTGTKSFIKDKLANGKKVIIFTPYQVSKSEYTSDIS